MLIVNFIASRNCQNIYQRFIENNSYLCSVRGNNSNIRRQNTTLHKSFCMDHGNFSFTFIHGAIFFIFLFFHITSIIHQAWRNNYRVLAYPTLYLRNTTYPAMSMRRSVGSVEGVLFTSSRSNSICAATLAWALTCYCKMSPIRSNGICFPLLIWRFNELLTQTCEPTISSRKITFVSLVLINSSEMQSPCCCRAL